MRSDTGRITGPVAAAAVLVLVVLGAAVGGSWELEERDFGGNASPREVELPSEPMQPLPVPTAPPASTRFDWHWVGVVGRVVATVVAAIVGWWLWTWVRRRLLAARRPMPAVDAVTTVVETPELPVLQRGVAAARRFLDEVAAPADAVIAAWLALEDAARASGVRRAAAQTPTEFTVAVLERTAADPAATRELLALYHRARFSGDPVSRGDVGRAARCLATLAASWDALDRPAEHGT